MPPGALMARWDPVILQASRKFRIPADWIRAVMRQESGGRTMLAENIPIVSAVGAMGVMQVMPGTYSEMAAQYGLGADPYNPRDNIYAGAAYLKWLHVKYGYPAMFAAYNDGPGNIEDHLHGGRPLPAETRGYIAAIGKSLGDKSVGANLTKVALTQPDGTKVDNRCPPGERRPSRHTGYLCRRRPGRDQHRQAQSRRARGCGGSHVAAPQPWRQNLSDAAGAAFGGVTNPAFIQIQFALDAPPCLVFQRPLGIKVRDSLALGREKFQLQCHRMGDGFAAFQIPAGGHEIGAPVAVAAAQELAPSRARGPRSSSRSSRASAASMPATRAATSRCLAASASRLPIAVRPSFRITQGKENPCPTKVARMTTKVTSSSSPRSGNGAGPDIRGIDSTAASDTTPRMPVKAMTNVSCQGGAGLCLRQRWPDPAGQIGADEDPDEAHQDDRAGHRNRSQAQPHPVGFTQ